MLAVSFSTDATLTQERRNNEVESFVSEQSPSPSPAPAQIFRVLEIIGGVVAIGGLIFWYATPGNFIWPPIIVILIGLALAGIAWFAQKNATKAATDDLVADLRAEQQRRTQTAAASSQPETTHTAPVHTLDPTLPAHSLAELAATNPELRQAIRSHPNVYPDLVAWIDQMSVEQ